ncbi:GH92 family glycosyl hydrolase [Mucilaginibacter yixingensis]|nr:GH92 family glycosyl hydrolase [Mucilaginibacter yixingensis]
MFISKLKRLLSVSALLCAHLSLAQQKINVTPLVDPFLGTYIGNTLPGANTPFGMVKVGPDVAPPNNTTGYRADRSIVGFSHNHVSGTGGGARYGNVLVIPQVGPVTLGDTLAHKYNEYAKPGYYTVSLGKTHGDVRAELTSTDHAAVHRYTFYVLDKPKVREAYIYGSKTAQSFQANLLVDASAIINSKDYEVGKCDSARIAVTSSSTMEGVSHFSGGWGGDNPYTVYFAIAFNRPCLKSGTWTASALSAGSKQAQGKEVGAWATFKLQQDEQVEMRVGISYLSTANARKNLDEVSGRSFEEIRLQADQLWNNYLSKIKVEGGSAEQRSVFYTALYHTMVMPVRLEGNPWKSNTPHYWDFYTLWDTYRTVMPLHTLVLPQRQTEIVNTLIDIYKHRGWLPDAWTGGDYAMVQGGTSADVVIADAILKGLPGIDVQTAYEAIHKDATTPSDNPFKYGRYEEYFRLGYCSSNVKNGSSKTLEYAYDDFCVAQAALKLGKKEDYKRFMKQSENCFNLFNSATGFFWAKDDKGKWIDGFSPLFRKPDYWNGPYFYEGTPFSYTFYVAHQLNKLMDAHGGRAGFVKFLDSLFDGRHFELGNEPGFLTPYLYNYAGRSDKTAERVRYELAQFMPGNIGLPGQDDSGAMSGWYVFGAMGFYPCAGQDLYMVGSPLFTHTTLVLANGKTFEVIAPKTSAANKYVQKVWLNGKLLTKPWFTHSAIRNGGKLVLEMGPHPPKGLPMPR